MFNLPSKSRKGVTVLFRRSSSHDVSFGDRLVALRTVGRFEGQLSPVGV